MKHQEAFTFDDILLVPAYNHHDSRRLVDIHSRDQLDKLDLALPILSANMDTITESAMANFMSSKGGMGVLHRFMSIERNVQEFRLCTDKTFVSIGCSEKE